MRMRSGEVAFRRGGQGGVSSGQSTLCSGSPPQADETFHGIWESL